MVQEISGIAINGNLGMHFNYLFCRSERNGLTLVRYRFERNNSLRMSNKSDYKGQKLAEQSYHYYFHIVRNVSRFYGSSKDSSLRGPIMMLCNV